MSALGELNDVVMRAVAGAAILRNEELDGVGIVTATLRFEDGNDVTVAVAAGDAGRELREWQEAYDRDEAEPEAAAA